MYSRAVSAAVLTLLTGTTVMAQASSANLSAFLSQVQSLASALDTASSTRSSSSSSPSSFLRTSATPTSSTSSSSSTQPFTSASDSSLPSSSPTSAAATGSTGDSGIDPRTRTIILAVVIPVCLILLAIILALIFCCCRRRRRRNRREINSEKHFAGNDEWHHGDSAHHGFVSNPSLKTGNSNGTAHGRQHHDSAPLIAGTTAVAGAAALHHHDQARDHQAHPNHDHVPLMAAVHHGHGHDVESYDPAPLTGAQYHDRSGLSRNQDSVIPGASAVPAMSEHPAYRNDARMSDPRSSYNSTTPIVRKPVPSRDSTGSNITTRSGRSGRSSHHAGLAAGAGALAGAAAMHHHQKKHESNGTMSEHTNRQSATSIPYDSHRQSSGSMAGAEPWQHPLGSHPSNPSMYATAPIDYGFLGQQQRRSGTPFSPDDVGAVHRSNHRYSQGPIEPSVAAHRNSSGSIRAPTAEQRRSLEKRNSSHSNPYDTPRGSRSPRRRSLTGGGEMWESEQAPALPSHRHFGSGAVQQYDPVLQPALPSNRHHSNVLKQHQNLHEATGSDTTVSSSDGSYASAQPDPNAWDYDEPGRYPRFSGGNVNSMAPLVPPPSAPAWEERRYSGDSYRSNRRSSNGERRLRFADGAPNVYNEHGLVGQAL